MSATRGTLAQRRLRGVLTLGVDIGGTKIALGLVSPEGTIVAREQLPTRVEAGPTDALSRTLDAVKRLEAAAGAKATSAGIGCPGPLNVKAGVVESPPNLKSWWGFPLRESFATGLGIPVSVENDANAAAMGEHLFGAGKGVDDFVYLTLSTGIGSGVVSGGRLVTGARGYAVEWGHTSVDYRGPLCECGARGCLEAMASGTAIAKAAGMSAPDVVLAVRAGDAHATQVWNNAMAALACGIANAVNAFNPSRVILGGGLTSAGHLLFDSVKERVPALALKPALAGFDIVPASLGGDVGILGAAALGFSRV